mmetsp:Transcript_63442/g.151787  ORF Transcript_63442/g.151787 Transcript_63442/m.151787 type:complete len:144 (-) Transcript_63442:27-458(-)
MDPPDGPERRMRLPLHGPGPGTSAPHGDYTALSNEILQEVYNAIITSTSQGDLIDPAPSRFTLLHNQRDRTAHHMCAVTEVMLDFYNGSIDTILGNEISFLWSGWDQEAVLRYMSAYIADLEHTFRNVLGRHTLEPELCERPV